MSLIDGHVEFAGWQIHIESAIEGDPYGYDGAQATYDSPAAVYDDGSRERNWVRIDCQVTQVAAGHGGVMDQTPGMRGRLGSLSAELYDPSRVLDPAATSYELLMRPGALVRLVAVQPGTGAVWPLWTGSVDRFEHDLKAGTGHLDASDFVALFAGISPVNLRLPQQNSAQRLQEAIDVATTKIPLSFAGTPTTLSTVQVSGNLWDGIVAHTAQADQSIVWIDQAGVLRRTEASGLGPPINATDCDDDVTPIIYTDLSSSNDDELLANLVTVERVNLEEALKERDPLWFSDDESVSYNGPHAVQNLSLPLLNDAALTAWARRVLDLRSRPTAGISRMAVAISDVLPWVHRTVPAIVALRVASVLDVRLTSRGEAERWAVAVAGIRHTITSSEWVVEVDVVDGPLVVENWGYDDARSRYDSTIYARYPGTVGPSLADIEAALVRVLTQEVSA